MCVHDGDDDVDEKQKNNFAHKHNKFMVILGNLNFFIASFCVRLDFYTYFSTRSCAAFSH